MSRLPDRAVLELTGPETRAFLQGLLTQDMARLETGAAFACLLTPQGKILYDGLIVPTADGVLIDVWREAADAFAKRLALYRLRAQIAIQRRDDLAVGIISGGDRGEDVGAAVAVYPDPRHGALAPRAIAPEAAFSGPPASYHGDRIALGVPEFGADFAGETWFLLDVNYDALNGVAYRKGCFVGQEVSSRMKRKSEARRRTLIAAIEGAGTPARGAAITAGGGGVGEILSSTIGGRALASVRVDRWAEAGGAAGVFEADGAALRLALPAYLEAA